MCLVVIAKAIHRSTLAIKLQCLLIGKLMTHDAALYTPTTRQMTSSMVMARIAVNPLFSRASWSAWCGTQRASGHIVRKADLPHARQAVHDRAAVRASVLKRRVAPSRSGVLRRPAGAAPKRKRDPFTLKRVGSLITGGVKRAAFRAAV